jgi:hypothetical protein
VVGLVVVLLTGDRLLYALPLGLHPGEVAPLVAAVLTLALFYAGRIWRELT